jgi:hypothetical protein
MGPSAFFGISRLWIFCSAVLVPITGAPGGHS